MTICSTWTITLTTCSRISGAAWATGRGTISTPPAGGPRIPPASSSSTGIRKGAIVIWSSLTADVTSVGDGVAVPYVALRKNPEFCLLFADHVQKHLFNDGPATVQSLV